MSGVFHNPDVRGREAQAASGETALYAYLVGTIHVAKTQLAVSTAMAAIIAVAAYAVTGGGVFLVCALAQVVIGIGRFARLAAYEARERQGLTRRDVVACDRAFALWSTIYALTLGVTCAALTLQEGQ